MDASQLQQYTQLMNAPAGSIPMQGGGSNQGLNNFFNTPGAQIQYGTGPATQVANGGQYNPAVAFQNDPGVQLAMQQAQNQVMNQSAARGLGGQSGALAQGLMNNAYNYYNNYTTGMGNLFGNYQNQLAGLTNLGAQSTGAQNLFNAGNTASSLLGNANLQTGTNLSNANLETGQNISSLLSGLGTNLSNVLLGTAGAQSNNLLQGAELGAQVSANNNASNAQSLSSMLNLNAFNNQNNQANQFNPISAAVNAGVNNAFQQQNNGQF